MGRYILVHKASGAPQLNPYPAHLRTRFGFLRMYWHGREPQTTGK